MEFQKRPDAFEHEVQQLPDYRGRFARSLPRCILFVQKRAPTIVHTVARYVGEDWENLLVEVEGISLPASAQSVSENLWTCKRRY